MAEANIRKYSFNNKLDKHHQPMAIHSLITADRMKPVENEDISSYAEATPILIEKGGALQFVPVLSKIYCRS